MAASATLAAAPDSTPDPDAPEGEKKPDDKITTTTEEDTGVSTQGGLMDALLDKDPAEQYSEQHIAQVEADKKASKAEIAKRLKDAKKRE